MFYRCPKLLFLFLLASILVVSVFVVPRVVASQEEPELAHLASLRVRARPQISNAEQEKVASLQIDVSTNGSSSGESNSPEQVIVPKRLTKGQQALTSFSSSNSQRGSDLTQLVFPQNGIQSSSLRILAVGSNPPMKFRALPNGGRVQLPIPEGKLPPRFVTIPVSQKEAEFLPLTLKRFTPQIKIDKSISVVQLFEGKVVGGQAWIEAKVKPGSSLLMVLT